MLRHRQQSEGRQPTTVSLSASNSHRVLEAVREGTADVGFVEGVRAPTGVRWAAIACDELVLVVAAGTSLSRRRAPLPPKEVAGHALTSREKGSGTREVLEMALAAHGLTVGESVVELTTASAIREAVLAGSAPAFVSRRVVARELQSGHLVAVPTTDTGLDLTRVFRAVWMGTRQPPPGPTRELVSLARTAEQHHNLTASPARSPSSTRA